MTKFKAKTLLATSLVILLFVAGRSVDALTISPLKTDMTLAPGETQVVMMTVANETNQEIYTEVNFAPFTPKDKQGAIALIGDATVVSWITLTQDSFILKAGEIREVPVIVSIPASATPGGYYGVALFKSGAGPNKSGNQVGISGQVGSLLLIKVDGELNHQLAIKDFTADVGQLWWRDKPVNFSLAIANEGNIHEVPDGMLVISDFFGRAIASTPINPKAGYVIPASEREFSFAWPAIEKSNIIFGTEWSPWMIGPYTFEIKSYYGPDRQLMTGVSRIIWVLPIRTLTILLGIIISALVTKKFIGRLTSKPN